MTEAEYVRKIVDALNDIGYAIKTNGNNFSVKGTPDVFACVKGQMVVIETKVDGNTPSDKQYLELEKWANEGAIAFWIMDTYANSIQVRNFVNWIVTYKLNNQIHKFTVGQMMEEFAYWMKTNG